MTATLSASEGYIIGGTDRYEHYTDFRFMLWRVPHDIGVRCAL